MALMIVGGKLRSAQYVGRSRIAEGKTFARRGVWPPSCSYIARDRRHIEHLTLPPSACPPARDRAELVMGGEALRLNEPGYEQATPVLGGMLDLHEDVGRLTLRNAEFQALSRP